MAGYKGHIAGGGIAAGCVYGLGVFLHGPMQRAEWVPASVYTLPGWPIGTWDGVAYGASLAAVCLLFSLFPDIDTESKGQRVFGSLLLTGIVVLIAARQFREASLLGVFAALPLVSNHRGWTHTKAAMVMVPLPIAIVPYLYMPGAPRIGVPLYIAAVVGYYTHLAIDGRA
jgi:membrane-bound metal-dependent hydrolase YbcI (DUF457 family)